MGKFEEIGLIFLFIFLLSLISRKIKLPYIVLLLLGGIIGKYFFSENIKEYVEILNLIALILLFFFLGLEFSPERLSGIIKTVFVPGITDLVLNFIPIFLTSYFLTKDLLFSLTLSSALYPTSTAITVKLLTDYKRTPYRETDILLGILIFEDIVAISMMSILTPLNYGGKINPIDILIGIGIISLLFLLFFLLKKPVEKIFMNLKIEEEVIAFLVLGIVFIPAGFLQEYHVSEALIAFFLGALIPEKSNIFALIQKNLYGLKEFSSGLFFFFFSFDTDFHFDKKSIYIIAVISVIAIISKMISTFSGAFFITRSKIISARAGLSFNQRGEFSLIIGSINPQTKIITPIITLITAVIGVVLFVNAQKVAIKLFKRKEKNGEK